MSNLNSIFDIQRGWPEGSALEYNFQPQAGVTLPEGTLVVVENRNLVDASVLRIVTDATGGGSPPSLTLSDHGKAYVVNTWGVGYTDGDIVEWNSLLGTAGEFVVVVPGVTGAPPDGTRAVVVEAGGAGSFVGHEEKVMSYATGTSTWSVADTPVLGNHIKIDDTDSIYGNKYYDYVGGAHPAGSWTQSFLQKLAPAYTTKLTSSGGPTNGTPIATPDMAWLIIQGNDQSDSLFTDRVTCLKLRSGFTYKVQHDDADTLLAGTKLQANAGVLEAFTDLWPVGQVIHSNGVNGSEGYIVVATT